MDDRQWCSTCKVTRTIIDQYEEDTGDSRRTVEVYWVMDLECGHQESVKTREYRSPLQQAGPTRSHSIGPDPYDESGYR